MSHDGDSDHHIGDCAILVPPDGVADRVAPNGALRHHKCRMPPPLKVLVAGAGVLLVGCSYTIRVPSYSLHTAAPASRFVAGVGKAELTPPPGIPLGGHGPAGRVSRGYWTRLYARAFYF